MSWLSNLFKSTRTAPSLIVSEVCKSLITEPLNQWKEATYTQSYTHTDSSLEIYVFGNKVSLNNETLGNTDAKAILEHLQLRKAIRNDKILKKFMEASNGTTSPIPH